jgi:hypothetical protein
MADNVPITAGTGTNIASDDVGGVQYQRVKLAIGADGVAVDASTASPVPTYHVDASVTGTISATDAVLGTYVGDGALKTGTPTANSYVALALPGGQSSYSVTLTGTFGGGTVWEEVSNTSTNGVDGSWTTALARQSGINNTVLDESLTAAGMYRGNASALTYVRWRITGATTPSVAVTGRVSSAPGAVFLNASIPTGSNVIGQTQERPASTSTLANVSGATSSTTLRAANTSRLGLAVFNDSTASLYIALAATASATAFTVFLAPGAYWVMDPPIYTGLVTGVWTAAAGTARVTELT